MNGGGGKIWEKRDVLTGSAKVSGSLLTLVLFLEEETSTEHLQEVASHMGTGVVCPIAAISPVLEELGFPAHCHYICCGTQINLSENQQHHNHNSSPNWTCDLFSLPTFKAHVMSTMFKQACWGWACAQFKKWGKCVTLNMHYLGKWIFLSWALCIM